MESVSVRRGSSASQNERGSAKRDWGDLQFEVATAERTLVCLCACVCWRHHASICLHTVEAGRAYVRVVGLYTGAGLESKACVCCAPCGLAVKALAARNGQYSLATGPLDDESLRALELVQSGVGNASGALINLLAGVSARAKNGGPAHVAVVL
jgi:hypothetical protein